MESQAAAKAGVKTAYWPELDLLRLFAFISVFLFHGPRFGLQSGLLWLVDRAFGSLMYGLALFFFLSSYLITALLLKEKKKTGSIHLKLFYARRILRIWPLYYFALVLAVVAPFIAPANRFSQSDLIAFVVFIGYLAGAAHGNPFGVLWSISVEELFYLVWPWIAHLRRDRLKQVSLSICCASLLACILTTNTWYNPLPQFLFFASGALLALWEDGNEIPLGFRTRVLMFFGGLFCWFVSRGIFWLAAWSFPPSRPASYLLADVGCVCIFLAFRHASIAENQLVRAGLYLGRISYGLYVFHLYCFKVVGHMLSRLDGTHVLLTDGLALFLAVGLASLSYSVLELPFLRFKERFNPKSTTRITLAMEDAEIAKSRAAGQI